ncbi:CAB39L [Symbiodinium natans]|uniref:CAB39L protein n=1 Tax=Symbiodinium natans TaxID=878477 RepID=A0A812SKN2_9DINO|nr:CAB39L [Symbiodinium natans]
MTSEVAPCMPFDWLRRASGRPALAGGGSEGSQNRSQDVCRRLKEALDSFLVAGDAGETDNQSSASPSETALKRLSQDVKKQLQVMLEVLLDLEKSSQHAGGMQNVPVVKSWLNQFLAIDLPKRLVTHLGQLEFEVRNDVVTVFSAVVRLGSGLEDEDPLQEYGQANPQFFALLVDGYEKPEIATHCGMMLRSCARQEKLVKAFLSQTQVVLKLVQFTRHEVFDISTDAFSSLHDFLLNHQDTSAQFLQANFRDYFTSYNSLLQEGDYVTKRQALKLLSDLLLGRKFMRIMMLYIGDDSYLQIHMNLLRDDSKTIQLEAFHIFKIFVANPNRPQRVHAILYKNKERLISLLHELTPHRPEDKQFLEDMKTVLNKLEALEPPPRPERAAPAGYPAGAAGAAAPEASPAADSAGGAAMAD